MGQTGSDFVLFRCFNIGKKALLTKTLNGLLRWFCGGFYVVTIFFQIIERMENNRHFEIR